MRSWIFACCCTSGSRTSIQANGDRSCVFAIGDREPHGQDLAFAVRQRSDKASTDAKYLLLGQPRERFGESGGGFFCAYASKLSGLHCAEPFLCVADWARVLHHRFFTRMNLAALQQRFALPTARDEPAVGRAMHFIYQKQLSV